METISATCQEVKEVVTQSRTCALTTCPIKAPIIIITTSNLLEEDLLGTLNRRLVDEDDCIAMLPDTLLVMELMLRTLEGGGRGAGVPLKGLAGGGPGWPPIEE